MNTTCKSWEKINQKTWRHKDSGFIICNESYTGISGRRQKIYAIYICLKAQDAGEVIDIKGSYRDARARANDILDKLKGAV